MEQGVKQNIKENKTNCFKYKTNLKVDANGVKTIRRYMKSILVVEKISQMLVTF